MKRVTCLACVVLFLTLGAWGSSYKIIYTFTGGADGAFPSDSGTLIIDHYDGSLYGTTQYGGQCGQGTTFILSPNGNGRWTNTVLHSFCGGSDGAYPVPGVDGGELYYACSLPKESCPSQGSVTDGGNGNLGGYFSTQSFYLFNPLWGGVTTPYAPSSGLSFVGNDGNAWPDIVDAGFYGGLNGHGGIHGTGSYADDYDFCSLPGCVDGANPASVVVQDGTYNRYGMTMSGGANNLGVVYEWQAKNTPNQPTVWYQLVVVHSFTGGTNDGAYPFLGGLTLGTQKIGTLSVPAIWGTTPEGGGPGCGGSLGCGTVFEMVKDPCFVICGWNFGLLHGFSGGADGGYPYSGLTNLNGTLYGTTRTGGQYGGGTIYSMAPDGSNFQVLWNFGKCVRKPTLFLRWQ